MCALLRQRAQQLAMAQHPSDDDKGSLDGIYEDDDEEDDTTGDPELDLFFDLGTTGDYE